MVYVPGKEFYSTEHTDHSCLRLGCCGHRVRKTLFLLIVAFSFCITVIFYLCPPDVCPIKFKWTRGVSLEEMMVKVSQIDMASHWLSSFNSDFLRNVAEKDVFTQRKSWKFDTEKNDVFVFLHIQKTGGSTMERDFVDMIDEIKCDCSKNGKIHCDCSRKNGESQEPWLISRYTALFGNKEVRWPCGLHPDMTELKVCAPDIMNKYYENPDRNLLFITILRDPLYRYISEFRHVQRGATWERTKHVCNGRSPTEVELPSCYKGKHWKGVQLEDFMKCPFNLGNNRQTRMLANLSKVHCYDTTAMDQTRREKLMLLSAMHNLMQMPYFALLEYQSENQFMFEKTFDLHCYESFKIMETGYANEYHDNLSETDLEKIKKVNSLDMKLFEFAKIVFFNRLKYLESKFGKNLIKPKIMSHKQTKYQLQNNLRRWKKERMGTHVEEMKLRKKKKKRKNKNRKI